MIINFKIFENSDDNKKEANKIISDYDPIVLKYEDNDGYFSVYIKDKNSEFNTWIDISIEDYEISAEWNQLTYNTNNSNDIIKSMIESDNDVFTSSISVSEDKLLADRMIYEEDGKYYYHKDHWYVKGGFKDNGIDYDKAKRMKKYNI